MSTVVLVGGSFLGAWAWERVTPLLEQAGHEVVALTLTGFGDRAHLARSVTGLSVHTQDIVAALEVADLTDVVLVAHSYAGAPATIAAARVPARIARVVYVGAALPEPGRTLFESAGPDYEQIVTAIVEAEGDGWLIPVMGDEVLDTYFGDHGLGTEDRAWLRARAVAHPVATNREPVPADLSAAEALPRTYVVCTGDYAGPYAGEPPVAEGTPGWHVVRLEAGHWPMVTAPAALAEVLDAEARR